MSSHEATPPEYTPPKRDLEASPEDSFRDLDVPEATEQTKVARWRLTRLSKAERDVFLSIDENGLRPRDLVDHTDWTESTIRTLLSRARKKLNK